jgi:acyl-CoA dehydrogenase
MSIAGNVTDTSASLAERIAAATEVAGAHAEAVDRDARFPSEAFAAIKASRLLSMMLEPVQGGDGASLAQVADVCFVLGRACGSTGLIFAMHQVKVACILRHHGGSPWQLAFLERLAREQLLLASSTTEGSAGGAVRSSEAAVERGADGLRLLRAATVISYGEQADAVVTTARRSAEADASDQVLIVLPRENYRLDPTGTWDTLGMRGTRSLGFALEAWGPVDQILETPYAAIHARTMVPAAHILWSSVWAGVAAEAVERARRYLRRKSRSGGGDPGPGGAYLVEARRTLATLRTLISAALERHQAIQDQPELLEAMEYQSSISLLKVQTSELAVSAVTTALRVCGLSGYRNDNEASVTRMLRDVLSAPLMISNDRILGDLRAATLLEPTPTTVSRG